MLKISITRNRGRDTLVLSIEELSDAGYSVLGLMIQKIIEKHKIDSKTLYRVARRILRKSKVISFELNIERMEVDFDSEMRPSGEISLEYDVYNDIYGEIVGGVIFRISRSGEEEANVVISTYTCKESKVWIILLANLMIIKKLIDEYIVRYPQLNQ